MPHSHPTTTTEAPDDGTAVPALAWLSVAAASAALNVSSKTVWRRARRGELTARKVAGERGAKVWEVRLDSTGQSNRPSGQNQTANRPKSPEIERKASGQTERTPNGQPAKATGQTDTVERGANAERMDEMKAEIAFLRNLVEAQQRDAVELRQSLKRALGLAPKQLTAGDATAIARDGPQRAQSGKVGKDSPATGNGQQRQSGARESAGIDYGAICDLIESDLLRKDSP